jgi:ribosomal protein S18 acetylase RimI-like enzyme
MAEQSLTKIRRFKLADIDKILEIEEQAFPKTAYSKEIFLHYAKHLPDYFIVLETAGDVAGYLLCDPSGHVLSTAVEPAHRRKGFGKTLFVHVAKCVKKRLWLEVRSKNTVAIMFYKSMGMKITGKIPHYYGTDNALIMETDV